MRGPWMFPGESSSAARCRLSKQDAKVRSSYGGKRNSGLRSATAGYFADGAKVHAIVACLKTCSGSATATASTAARNDRQTAHCRRAIERELDPRRAVGAEGKIDALHTITVAEQRNIDRR